MASSIAAMTMPRSIDFSRATASAICSSSSRLALTAMRSLSFVLSRCAGRLPAACSRSGERFRGAVRMSACRRSRRSRCWPPLPRLQRGGDQRLGEHEPWLPPCPRSRSSTSAGSSGLGIVAADARARRLRRRADSRGSARRPSTATAISILTGARHSARNPSAAPAAGRCPGEEISSR